MTDFPSESFTRLADAAERIATALEQIAGFMAPAIDKAPLSDGWIEWPGGECPVPAGTIVDVKDRDGTLWRAQAVWPDRGYVAHQFWDHGASLTPSSDIVAYRLAR